MSALVDDSPGVVLRRITGPFVLLAQLVARALCHTRTHACAQDGTHAGMHVRTNCADSVRANSFNSKLRFDRASRRLFIQAIIDWRTNRPPVTLDEIFLPDTDQRVIDQLAHKGSKAWDSKKEDIVAGLFDV